MKEETTAKKKQKTNLKEDRNDITHINMKKREKQRYINRENKKHNTTRRETEGTKS